MLRAFTGHFGTGLRVETLRLQNRRSGNCGGWKRSRRLRLNTQFNRRRSALNGQLTGGWLCTLTAVIGRGIGHTPGSVVAAAPRGTPRLTWPFSGVRTLLGDYPLVHGQGYLLRPGQHGHDESDDDDERTRDAHGAPPQERSRGSHSYPHSQPTHNRHPDLTPARFPKATPVRLILLLTDRIEFPPTGHIWSDADHEATPLVFQAGHPAEPCYSRLGLQSSQIPRLSNMDLVDRSALVPRGG